MVIKIKWIINKDYMAAGKDSHADYTQKTTHVFLSSYTNFGIPVITY